MVLSSSNPIPFPALHVLRCPTCRQHRLNVAEDLLLCKCQASYPISKDVARLIDDSAYGSDQKKMSDWWDDLSRQWYAEFDSTLDSQKLYDLLPELEETYAMDDHLTRFVELGSISGKWILDIGCGGGVHDALFRRYGAHVCAVDISLERAASTAFKLSLLREGSGFAAQADGENLPFLDNSFDLVYSNGVMHHSESTEKMVSEAFRVLRPGGQLVIMLYAKVSLQYLMHFLWDGIMKGYIVRYGPKYWLGAATEGRPRFGTTRNPFTRAYTERGVRRLLAQFKPIDIQKCGLDISVIPYFGRRIRSYICRKRGMRKFRDTMVLRAGQEYYVGYLPFEGWFGRYLGWSLQINARKPG